VVFIGDQAFGRTSLDQIYLLGNAPVVGADIFSGDQHLADNTAFAYYLPGTTGWGSTFGYLPLVLWNPKIVTDDRGLGVHSNLFGFNICSTNSLVVVVEACTNLSSPDWQPVQTNTFMTGTTYFSDPQGVNPPGHFYRLRSP
jgi:hypothetical protein